ncbi:COAC decarboxylase, partial [Polyodon spathula]|nr:COAC decarboxylase [Polyodon spathula]
MSTSREIIYYISFQVEVRVITTDHGKHFYNPGEIQVPIYSDKDEWEVLALCVFTMAPCIADAVIMACFLVCGDEGTFLNLNFLGQSGSA